MPTETDCFEDLPGIDIHTLYPSTKDMSHDMIRTWNTNVHLCVKTIRIGDGKWDSAMENDDIECSKRAVEETGQ